MTCYISYEPLQKNLTRCRSLHARLCVPCQDWLEMEIEILKLEMFRLEMVRLKMFRLEILMQIGSWECWDWQNGMALLGHRTFLINIDCIPAHGTHDHLWRELEVRRERQSGTKKNNHYIAQPSIFHTYVKHWWNRLYTAAHKVPAHYDPPQVQSWHGWSIWLHLRIENSTLDTITSHLQTSFFMEVNMNETKAAHRIKWPLNNS